MELARLRAALGEGQVEVEIDKLRALLGSVEADVRLLRQVKEEGQLHCTDGEFILRSPERRKKLLTRAVSASLDAPEVPELPEVPEVPVPAPPGAPAAAVPQGLRSVKSALELRKAPLLRPLGSGHPLTSSSASFLPGVPKASRDTKGGGQPELLARASSPIGSGDSCAKSSASGSPRAGHSPASSWEKRGELAQPKASQPFFRPRGFAEKHEAEGSPSRSPRERRIELQRQPLPLQRSSASRRGVPDTRGVAPQAAQASDLLLRLEAAGIGPWQIAELKASEARLAQLAAESPCRRVRIRDHPSESN
ncbi:unnamed protein product [Effrenium voratum]|nr:unnamed protein product [Effrenium voratum]